MRYRRYYPSARRDGSFTVVSHGGGVGLLRGLAWVWIPLVFVTYWWQMFETHWATGVILFCLCALVIPGVNGLRARGWDEDAVRGFRFVVMTAILVGPLLAVIGYLAK